MISIQIKMKQFAGKFSSGIVEYFKEKNYNKPIFKKFYEII